MTQVGFQESSLVSVFKVALLAVLDSRHRGGNLGSVRGGSLAGVRVGGGGGHAW